jgi:hypothetical protein
VNGQWDVYRAELADTQRGQHSARQARPCIYCGAKTKSVYQVCLDHTDLTNLDPSTPDALEKPRERTPSSIAQGSRPSARGSSSAARHVHTGPGLAALHAR